MSPCFKFFLSPFKISYLWYLLIFVFVALFWVVVGRNYRKHQKEKEDAFVAEQIENYSDNLIKVINENDPACICKYCNTVSDGNIHNICPSCGAELEKTKKIKEMTFGKKEYDDYKRCMQSPDIDYIWAASCLIKYHLSRVSRYVVKHLNSDYTLTCDACGEKIKTDMHNCPNCGNPYGEDIEFLNRYNIIVSESGLWISDQDVQKLYRNFIKKTKSCFNTRTYITINGVTYLQPNKKIPYKKEIEAFLKEQENSE